MTTVTRDDDSPNIYTVTVGRFNIQTSVYESKYEEIHRNALIFPGGYISKKKPSKISEKNTIRLYIVPGSPTLFYQQGNQNSCIITSLVLALYYMGDEYASKYIIKRIQKSFLEIHNKGRMHLCRNIFLWDITEKKTKKY